MPLSILKLSSRRRGVVAGCIIALAVAACLAPRLIAGPSVGVHRVSQRDFVQSVVATGHVEAPHRVTIGTVIVGSVLRVPVDEGQAVAAGQTLVELDPAEWRATAAQADAAVAQAQARLRQVGELESPVAAQTLRQAEVTLANARRQQERDATLLAQGFIGPAAMDDADKAVALAQAQLQAAQAQLRASLPAGADDAVAATALVQARSAAAVARAQLGHATIFAPVAGTLIARNVEPGDVVQPGTALMVLSPAGPVQLVVDIDEKNIHLLALDQPARASADAFADRLFDARVSYINPGVDLQRGSVEVKLDVDAPPAFLRQDMTVSVDIQIATRRHALLVPLDAVHDAQGARPWVFAVEGGHARRRELRLGLRSAGYAEVLDGLAAGELVVPAAANVGAGDRLRAVQEPVT
jgi:HlyD family secretion protein